MKKFDEFVKESTENKGKGIDGDTDLFPRPPLKQTIDKGVLNPINNIGIAGRQITTEKIDGIIKGVKDGTVYVEDRLTKEVKEYPIAEFLKEFNKAYKKDKKVEESLNLTEDDKQLLTKIVGNETKKDKDLWEKKWENFATNYVKASKEIEDEEIEDKLDILTENTTMDELFGIEESCDCPNKKVEDSCDCQNEKPEKPEKPEMKIERFSDFSKKLKLKSHTIEEDLETEETEEDVNENSVPKPLPQVKCDICEINVNDNREDKIGHLYSKHNFKPSADKIEKWLLEYFPPIVEEEKKKK